MRQGKGERKWEMKTRQRGKREEGGGQYSRQGEVNYEGEEWERNGMKKLRFKEVQKGKQGGMISKRVGEQNRERGSEGKMENVVKVKQFGIRKVEVVEGKEN